MIKDNEAIQVIQSAEITFEHPHPDIFIAKTKIANASWINTSEGTVLIDTLLHPAAAEIMKERILESGGLVKYIILTHHHFDHIGGATVFLKDKPEIIAHRFLIDNLEKYKLLREHRARISSIQFNIPYSPRKNNMFIAPTRTFDNSMTFFLGGKSFELYHARAETDDAVWIYIPDIKTVFAGDLIITGFPNIGNPFKPTRFALSWARALEAVRAKQPELLISHGGRAVYEGGEIKELLDVTIEAIYSIHDQVVDYINKGVPVDEIIHLVKLPDYLKNNDYLKFVYSRPEFAVYNIYRWYHGYFDHNPAHLLPRPNSEVNEEIFKLIGSDSAIFQKSEELLTGGQPQLSLQVLDIVLKHDVENIEARKLRLKILKVLCEEDYCLMSHNTWVYFIDIDREFLASKGVIL